MSFTALTSTGWSSFWQLQGGKNFGANPSTPYASLYSRSGNERQIARAMGRAGFRGMRAIIRKLNGNATGTTVTDTYARVSSPLNGAVTPGDFSLGGLRTIDTITDVNAVTTTTAQQAYINKQMIDNTFIPNPNAYDPTISNNNPGTSVPYPVDLSGNGGGGKLGR